VEVKTITAENGTYSIPALDAGVYVVTVMLPGFKVAVINNVKIDTGVPATVRVTLEVGNATETVEVVAAGAEILQYQTATISTTLQVAQVSNLPLVSRNPLNFLVLMPGVNTPGQNRNSTIKWTADQRDRHHAGRYQYSRQLQQVDGWFLYARAA